MLIYFDYHVNRFSSTPPEGLLKMVKIMVEKMVFWEFIPETL